MSPQDFIAKWGANGPAAGLNERQGAQPHFMDLCALLGVPTPGSAGDYVFEQGTQVLGEARGYADVFLRDHFAWENKAPGKDLDGALRQLRNYSMALGNPPLLVVCDRLTIRIHTAFNGHPSEVHTVQLKELAEPAKQSLLRRLWTDVESFRPRITSRDITEAAAKSFATLADRLRKDGNHPDQVAHFLTQCLFCFFAEDVGLLPRRMFEGLVNNRKLTSAMLGAGLLNLFNTMRTGGMYGNDNIPWFNGGLFKTVQVPELDLMDVSELRKAAALNWSAIDVSIFGTLFERGLDPAKRSQLGAHYTDPATIQRIIEPVLERQLLQIWERLTPALQASLAKSKKKNDAAYQAAQAQFITWLDQLKNFRVLDPACGSGNFLFLGLKALKDIEHQSHLAAEKLGLERQADLVTGPHNMLGIELNEYAAELARVTVWIGELQWRMAHGYEFKTNPVLEPLDNIEHRDALITQVAARASNTARTKAQAAHHEPVEGPPSYVEADWPWASIVIGNPPFLGDKRMRTELGDTYTEALRKVYEGRVPGGADLVTYWFEKGRTALEKHGLGAAGFVATQSVRAGANRKVLARICHTSRIYQAWSDMPWVNDGAAVRVSLVCFGWGGNGCILDDMHVPKITAGLSNGASLDLTQALPLHENLGYCFVGSQKGGAFEVSGFLARSWLALPNVNGRSTSEVVRPWANGQDLTRRSSDQWIVDFGNDMSESEASQFDTPFAYIVKVVKSARKGNREAASDRYWWLHQRPRPEMRSALKRLSRFIATPRVAKHRFFVYLSVAVLADSRVCAIAREDDFALGVLSSRIHEVWSLANASMHGVGNDPTYNAKSCFETFPFPPGLTPADTASQQTEQLPSGACIPAGLSEEKVSATPADSALAASKNIAIGASPKAHAVAIAQAAHRLNALREAWLNPPEWTQRLPEVVPLGLARSPYPERVVPRAGHEAALAERTLTKLYNLRPQWLAAAHEALDATVAAAYGWADYSPAMADDTLLQRLLALNALRAEP